MCFSWSITPMMYPASFIFKEPSTAYIALIVANLFIGITCIVTSFLLEMFRNDKVIYGEPCFQLFPLFTSLNIRKNMKLYIYFNTFVAGLGQSS